MSGNPNNVKLGKRRPASTPKVPVTEDTAKNKKAKLIADELLKRRAAGETKNTSIHPQFVSLVEDFLIDHGLSSTLRTFKIELGSRVGKEEVSKDIPSLATLFYDWQNMKSHGVQENKEIIMSESIKMSEKSSKKTKDKKQAQKSSDNSNNSDIEMQDAPPVEKKDLPSSSASTSSESSSDSSSESDTDTGAKVTAKKSNSALPRTAGSKRKAPVATESSSESDSSSAPKSKKVKRVPDSNNSRSSLKAKSESSPSDESSSSSESSSDDETDKESDSSGSGSSSSDSDSSSSSNSLARKTPLPESESETDSSESSESSDSSESESDSSSDSNNDPTPPQKSKKDLNVSKKPQKQTMVIPAAPLPPDPVIKGKKTNQPFSRIPKDIKVDERLASNAYVPYDYAQKAHEDLIVTKGKGFTKEKNKKKRGSYKGGYIDVEGKKSVKFED